MAGKGPPPAEEKRRRNKPPAFDELPWEGHDGPFPPLPASYGVDVDVDVIGEDGEKSIVTRRKQVKYLHDTREWYETWARSPMATKFTGVDWNRLRRMATLADTFYRRPTKDMAQELRLQEASFGGSPLDRLRAQIKIAAPVETAASTPVGASKATASRRARLSVVKTDAA